MSGYIWESLLVLLFLLLLNYWEGINKFAKSKMLGFPYHQLLGNIMKWNVADEKEHYASLNYVKEYYLMTPKIYVDTRGDSIVSDLQPGRDHKRKLCYSQLGNFSIFVLVII